MKQDHDTPDLSGLLPALPVETMAEARDELIANVMSRQQALSTQFSKIDHPFASDDVKDDYELAREEFQALIQCAVHMPESVEGIRFLQEWYAQRLAKLDMLRESASAGTRIAYGEGAEVYVMTADFAKGMRATLAMVKTLFSAFPLELTTTPSDDDLD